MTKKLTTINRNQIGEKPVLPFNGSAVSEKSFSFSFACFDRDHDLFNLGDHTSDGTVSGKWFLDLLDCLKSVSNMTIPQLKNSSHDFHPIDWDKTNTRKPENSIQCDEYWQFRLNKSKGRVIGFLIDGVFYIVWLDPHHNLTNSEGYGGVNRYKAGRSIYEEKELEIEELKRKNRELEEEKKAALDLLNEKGS